MHICQDWPVCAHFYHFSEGTFGVFNQVTRSRPQVSWSKMFNNCRQSSGSRGPVTQLVLSALSKMALGLMVPAGGGLLSIRFKITHMTLQVSEFCLWAPDPHLVTAVLALSPDLHMLTLACTLSSSGCPNIDVLRILLFMSGVCFPFSHSTTWLTNNTCQKEKIHPLCIHCIIIIRRILVSGAIFVA